MEQELRARILVMVLHKIADRAGEDHHETDRDDDRGDHDGEVLRHADGGDDQVERAIYESSMIQCAPLRNDG